MNSNPLLSTKEWNEESKPKSANSQNHFGGLLPFKSLPLKDEGMIKTIELEFANMYFIYFELVDINAKFE